MAGAAAMNLLRLWKPNKNTTTTALQATTGIKAAHCHNDDEDEEDDSDSFIELELALPNYDAKLLTKTAQHGKVLYKSDTDSEFSSKRASTTSTSSCEDSSFYRAINRVDEDSSDNVRLRTKKTTEKTPLSILRSPTIRGLMLFGRKRSRKSETENVFGLSPRRLNTETEAQHSGGKFFPVRFRPSNNNGSRMSTDSAVDERAGVGKYLNLLSPLHHIKRRSNGGERVKEPEDFGASPSGKWWIDKVKQKVDVRRSRSRLGVVDRRSAVGGGWLFAVETDG